MTTVQVFVLSRIKLLLVSLSEKHFFHSLHFLSPPRPGYSPQILHKNDRETQVLLRFYQRARNSLFFIQFVQFLARYRGIDKG